MESKGAKDSGGGGDDAKGSEAKGSSQPAAAESKHQRGGGGGGDAKATSEVVAYAREVHQTFMVHADTDYNGVNAEGHPWKLSTRKPELGDLEIYYSKVTGSKYSRWHSVCVLPHPVDEVYPAILDVQHRLTWDRGLEGHESVAVTAQGTDVPTRDGSVAVQRFISKAVGPVAARDTCVTIMTKLLDDGRVVSAGGSLPPDLAEQYFPEERRYVRMVTMSSGFMFAPHGPGGAHTKLTYGLHIDLKGWFNAFIQEQLMCQSLLSLMEDLRTRLKGANSKEWLAQRDARFQADAARIEALASDQGLHEGEDGGAGPGSERDSDAKK